MKTEDWIFFIRLNIFIRFSFGADRKTQLNIFIAFREFNRKHADERFVSLFIYVKFLETVN